MDALLQIDRIPPSAVNQLQRLCALLKSFLPTLDGVILHGSAASSGFEPSRSDLDVLVIVNEDPDKGELAQVSKGLLTISGDPHALELSIIAQACLVNWQHPCPHLLHFGEEMRERFESGLFVPVSPTDDDLTMHLVVARARGIDLIGTYSVSKLPEISRLDYLSAILNDFRWAENQEEDLSGYVMSNACRTLAYLRDGVILSKSEGRQWCADRGINNNTIISDVTQKMQGALSK